MCKDDFKIAIILVTMLALVLWCGYWVVFGSSDVNRFSEDEINQMAQVDYARTMVNDSVSYK